MRWTVFQCRQSFASVILCVCASQVHCADLLSSYQEASQNDVQWLAALSKYQQSAEFKALAASRLLPNLSYAQTKNNVTQDAFDKNGAIDPAKSGNYPSSTKVLTLRQPVIRAQDVVGMQVANAQTDRAHYAFRDEKQQLALRVVSNYLDAIHARVTLNTAQAFRLWAFAYLDVVQAKVKRGQASGLDEANAVANFEKYQAQEIQATEFVSLTANQLALLTGSNSGGNLRKLDAFDIKLIKLPQFEILLSKAVDQSPRVLLASMDAEIAQASLRQARAAHLPTLDLVAQVSNNLADNPYFQSSQTKIRAVGAQLTVPLYSGGATNSQIRANIKEYEQAEYRRSDSINKARISTQTEFNMIKSGISVIRAYQTAWDAAKMATEFNKLGSSIGYQSEVDRLRALAEQEQAQLTLHQAKVDVIKSWFRLNAILGEIDEGMVATYNEMLR